MWQTDARYIGGILPRGNVLGLMDAFSRQSDINYDSDGRYSNAKEMQ